MKGDNCNAERVLLISIPAGGTYTISLKSIDHNKPTGYGSSMTFSLEWNIEKYHINEKILYIFLFIILSEFI